LHHLSIRSFREIDHLLSLFLQKERDVCASKQGEVNPVWMLRFVQHDKSGKCGCFASLSMTAVWSFRTLFFVIPSVSEESIAWMLRFAQHDKGGVVPHALFCHSEHSFLSFRTLFFVIPSVSEESSMDASLRSA